MVFLLNSPKNQLKKLQDLVLIAKESACFENT